MFKLEPEEELIKITKPHSASFLSSPTFLIGTLIIILGISRGLFPNHVVVRIILTGAGLLLVGLSYLRRVSAYTFYFTSHRVVSNYSFLRKAYREIRYDKMMDVKVLQDLFGKACGYADVWMYGYQNGWVVGRMRGVRLGDSYIVVNKAWKKQS
ncbi:MAG TPA: PH domain-containing protein [Candidatus Hodarchaeales archaeon]|nr:PH domain-containing protein [Candidatus Hodarchaeales archaeon]